MFIFMNFYFYIAIFVVIIGSIYNKNVAYFVFKFEYLLNDCGICILSIKLGLSLVCPTPDNVLGLSFEVSDPRQCVGIEFGGVRP